MLSGMGGASTPDPWSVMREENIYEEIPFKWDVFVINAYWFMWEAVIIKTERGGSIGGVMI